MSKEVEISLRPLADRIRSEMPEFKISVANSYAIRGSTAKGDYEVRVFIQNREIRTTFLRRGSNPLKGIRLICRTNAKDEGLGLDEHLAAIRTNQEKLPLIEKRIDAETGDEFVSVMPLGSAPNAPRVQIRKSARTGFLSMDVKDAFEMSPVEARLIGKAINRACKIAAAERLTKS